MTDQFELEAESAVAKLTEPWVDVVITGTGKSKTYARVEHPAMIDMLAAAKRSGSEASHGASASASTRAPANIQAITLWNHIDATTRRAIRALSKGRIEPDLIAAILQLQGILKAAHASNGIVERDYVRYMRDFPRWAASIWEMFDPPRVKTLDGETCPHCEAVIFVNAEKVKSAALIAYYWKGLEPEAKCQVCGVKWQGMAQLVNLGRLLKAEMDEETLREFGAA